MLLKGLPRVFQGFHGSGNFFRGFNVRMNEINNLGIDRHNFDMIIPYFRHILALFLPHSGCILQPSEGTRNRLPELELCYIVAPIAT